MHNLATEAFCTRKSVFVMDLLALFHYFPDLKDPKTFNEKIQCLKLYDHNPLYTICADKLLVRDYVREKIGEKYLIKLLAVFDKPEDISLSLLPDKFAMKLNTGPVVT